ncbi:MAG TPA: hypothetical protein VK946_03590 [Methylotenera sp.]|nr:hypothetical protein [Methylotenera sp.]
MSDNAELTPNETLVQNEILVGERLYADAINIILANAHHELLIFDQDLMHGDFTSIQKYELLREFLSKNINSQLTIILQNTTFFQEKCPRLVSLLSVYGHKMIVYETNDSAKHAKDCFVLADDKHYIKRIHIDQARFKYALDDPTSVDVLNLRFNELLEATHNMVSITKLGL